MTISIKFTFSQCLRHAFMSGAGYGDLEKISDADQQRWATWEPPTDRGIFKTMDEHFGQHEKDIQRLDEDAHVMTMATVKIEEQREEIKRLKKALEEIRDHTDVAFDENTVRELTIIAAEALR